MPRKPLDITQTELAILDVLWEQGEASIGRITDELYSQRTTGKYATVQKLLERLEAKGCVKRDHSSFAHVFSTKVNRETLIGKELENLARKLCNGSLTPLLVHLAETTRLSPEDRRVLRRLIDDAPSASSKRKRPKS